jgi:hypothetical protein
MSTNILMFILSSHQNQLLCSTCNILSFFHFSKLFHNPPTPVPKVSETHGYRITATTPLSIPIFYISQTFHPCGKILDINNLRGEIIYFGSWFQRFHGEEGMVEHSLLHQGGQETERESHMWWYSPVIPACGRIVSSRAAWAT